MWEDNSKLHTIIIICLSVFMVALAVAFLYIFKNVRNETEQTDTQLLEVYEQHQIEQQEERLASIADVEAEYLKDVETVSKYLPGIVCWGDTLTVGAENGVSYPSTLQSLINEHICDIYDFRSTIENADDMSRVDWDDYTIEIPVENLGGGGEDCNTILGRNGAVPFCVRNDFTIPAETEPVEISIISSNGSSVKPILRNDAGTNPVTICGITGVLSVYNYGNGAYKQYYFTRSNPGEPVEVSAGEEIITGISELYKDYVSVIFIGSYGGFDSPGDLINKINAIRKNRTSNIDRYIVIGFYAQSDNNYYCDVTNYEARLQSEFGEHFINLRKYLITDAMDDAGLEITSQDQQKINVGEVPYSLLTSRNSIELTATGYKLIGGLIYDRMESLGYFDEVVDELGLKETRKELQKQGTYIPRNLNNTITGDAK